MLDPVDLSRSEVVSTLLGRAFQQLSQAHEQHPSPSGYQPKIPFLIIGVGIGTPFVDSWYGFRGRLFYRCSIPAESLGLLCICLI